VPPREFGQEREPRRSLLLSGRDAHEAGQLQACIARRADEPGQIRDGAAAFLRLVGDVHLDEAVGQPARRRPGAGDRCDQRRPVDRVDHVEQFDRLRRFVGLELPHQVEADVGIQLPQRRPFGRGFLHPILAEVAVPRR
jgi:hypothetical protein